MISKKQGDKSLKNTMKNLLLIRKSFIAAGDQEKSKPIMPNQDLDNLNITDLMISNFSSPNANGVAYSSFASQNQGPE